MHRCQPQRRSMREPKASALSAALDPENSEVAARPSPLRGVLALAQRLWKSPEQFSIISPKRFLVPM
jgi:hypothetical protein